MQEIYEGESKCNAILVKGDKSFSNFL